MKIAIIAGIRGRPGDLPKLKGNSKTNIFTAELAADFRQMSAHQNHLARESATADRSRHGGQVERE